MYSKKLQVAIAREAYLIMVTSIINIQSMKKVMVRSQVRQQAKQILEKVGSIGP